MICANSMPEERAIAKKALVLFAEMVAENTFEIGSGIGPFRVAGLPVGKGSIPHEKSSRQGNVLVGGFVERAFASTGFSVPIGSAAAQDAIPLAVVLRNRLHAPLAAAGARQAPIGLSGGPPASRSGYVTRTSTRPRDRQGVIRWFGGNN